MDNIEEVLPLSPAQEGMLFETLDPRAQPGTYLAVITLTIDGPLDPQKFQKAFHAVISDRDALRASFIWEGVRQAVQLIHKNIDVPFQFLDWSQTANFDADLDAFITNERKLGFDLKTPPLMRGTLIKHSAIRHHFVWAAHHLVSDGWSTGVLINDIQSQYDDKKLPSPNMTAAPFKQYLAWLKSRDSSSDQKFWTEYLAGVTTPTSIAHHPAKTHTSGAPHQVISSDLPENLVTHLKETARKHRVTPASLLSTNWGLILRRYSGESDVVFGQTNSGRPSDIKGIEGAVGAFINTLPVRLKINPQMTASKLWAEAQADAIKRRTHEHASLSDVLNWSEFARGNRIFDTLFVVEDFPPTSALKSDISITTRTFPNSSSFPLTLLVVPGPTWTIEAVYEPEQLSDTLVRHILDDYITLLKGTLDTPDIPISDLTQTIWKPSPKTTQQDPKTLLNDILGWADQTPDAPALNFAEDTLSYAELVSASTDLAGELQRKGVGPGDIVPIALMRSTSTVVAMLAILQTGAAYTPLDLNYPKNRLSQILSACAPKCVVTSSKAATLLDTQADTILIDGPAFEQGAFSPVDINPNDPAYVIFTSGSTGTPKGVKISHANLAYSTNARQTIYTETPKAFLLMSSFAFDSSVVGLYWTLTQGGKLVISNSHAEQDLPELSLLIARQKISHLLCLPSLYLALLKSSPRANLATLQTAIVAGEPVSRAVLEAHQNTQPHTRLFNEYGPTEATVWCAASDLSADFGTGPIPIGRPPEGTHLTIIDADGCPLPDGVSGEITTTGPGTALGYLNDPDATAKAFNQSTYRTGDLGYIRSDGEAILLGRIDDQIKIRGHRIEPRDVEANIIAATGYTQLAVIAKNQKLICFLEEDPSQFDAARTMKTIKSTLPAHMVPATLRALIKLPQLPNGKTDLNALSALPDEEAPPETDRLQPSTFTEIKLAEIWKEVLDLKSISREANFFDLGGDSLNTITAALKAEKRGLNLAAHELFEYPVLKDLADRLHARAEALQETLPIANLAHGNDDGEKTIFFMIHGSLKMYSYLSSTFGKNRPLGFIFSHYVGGQINMATRIEDLAAEAYDKLKSLKPNGPYKIGGYSLGAVIALELVDRLVKEGDRVEMLFMLDPSYDVGKPQKIRPRSQLRSGKLAQNIWARVGMALAGLRRLITPDADNLAKFSYIRRAYMLILTYYRPPQYDGKSVVMMSNQSNDLHKKSGWLDAALGDFERHDLAYDHFDLQKDPDALMAWTSKLAALLHESEGP